jgi:hypothetical protein
MPERGWTLREQRLRKVQGFSEGEEPTEGAGASPSKGPCSFCRPVLLRLLAPDLADPLPNPPYILELAP